MNAMSAGAFLSLFDRLDAEADAAFQCWRAEADELGKSLQRDLVRLFNVRNTLGIESFMSAAPNSLHYGLPDLMALAPRNPIDLQRLERVLLRAITLYEPRLIQVRVQARSDPAMPVAALVTISALATLNRQPHEVHVDLVLDGQSTRASAPEPQP